MAFQMRAHAYNHRMDDTNQLKAAYLTNAASRMNARARENESAGLITTRDLEDLLQACKGHCEWCGAPLERGFEFDHIVPIVLGGPHQAENLAVVCMDCNRRKGSELPVSWAQRLLIEGKPRTTLMDVTLRRAGIEGWRQPSLFAADEPD
jgi:5-methylcytosine-specific restriction endonuclease McrA